jgi:hypothetical protein
LNFDDFYLQNKI